MSTGLLSPSSIVAAVGAELGVPCRLVRVLAHRPGATCVVQVSTSQGRLLVAKSAVDDSAGHGARVAAALVEADLAPLAVPRPVRYLASRRVSIQESVPGAAPTQLEPASFGQIGAGVARLHASPVVIGPATSIADHLCDLLRPQPSTLARALPGLAAEVHELLEILSAQPTSAAAPIHRDLHPRQLLLDGPHVHLLDWDVAVQGDPALDVGNLCAYLRARWPAGAAESAVTAFLAGYAPLAGPGVLDRVGVFEAFAGLRLACKTWRLHGPASEPAVAGLLARARACADRVGEAALAAR